jgi:hypothetical protein
MSEGTTGQVSSHGCASFDVSQRIKIKEIWSVSRIVDAAITKFQIPIIK